MKALKIVLIACSLSAAVAHAQTPAPAASSQQVAQAANEQRVNTQVQEGRVARASRKANECVGPVSFCNIYAGS